MKKNSCNINGNWGIKTFVVRMTKQNKVLILSSVGILIGISYIVFKYIY